MTVALENFGNNGLKQPVSFRAPNLVINNDTIRLLEEYHLYVDSSAPSYYGVPPLPFKPLGQRSRLITIPVTASPLPKFKIKYLLPYSHYKMFTMPTLVALAIEALIDYIKTIVSFQNSLGITPHLVFVAHSWEFGDVGNRRKFQHCSSANYNLLESRFRQLRGAFDIKFVTISELYEVLSREF
ncbi:hypothetical protein ES703_116216 [subsurface metagenome]